MDVAWQITVVAGADGRLEAARNHLTQERSSYVALHRDSRTLHVAQTTSNWRGTMSAVGSQ